MTRPPDMPPTPADLPEFSPSPDWGRGVAAVRSLGVTPAVPCVYEAALADLAMFVGEVEELFRDRRPGHENMRGLDSLYLGPSGRFFLLRPHTHDETARSVLRAVHPELPTNKVGKHRKAGGYEHTDLTLVSGIQRVQIYSAGVGVTVEMGRPPNRTQLDAVRSACLKTPMGRFGAEINVAGTTIGWFTSFGEVVEFVNGWDPSRPDEMVRKWPWLAGVLVEGG